MDGIEIRLHVEGLPQALSKLDALGRIEFHELLDGLARMGQQQTRRRIEEEKTGPDGAAWAPARIPMKPQGTEPMVFRTRPALFVTGTHLWRSIDHLATANEAIWGTGWIGAKVHQFGAVIQPVHASALRFQWGVGEWVLGEVTIPARPYLGVSPENAADMESAGVRFMERYL